MLRSLQLALVLFAPLVVFAAMIAADRSFGTAGRGYSYVLRVELPQAGEKVGLPAIDGPPDSSRPLVVLDPGHGGHDPGAGSGSLKEKALTLQLARALRDELLSRGGIRVALTRNEDRYLLLAERASIARRLKADLFVSIHADSAENDMARGASVYTLSKQGSSEAAAKIATRENEADMINGVALAGTSDVVSAILIDLSQRETLSSSTEFAGLILRESRGEMRLHVDKVQSAAFAVLKSPDLPSVLMEAGYISNSSDAALLTSDEGQDALTGAMSRAIRAYFARRANR